MKNYQSNTEFKRPIEIENIVKRLMADLEEEQIYDLAVVIRKEIEKLTGESISEWSGAFQIILDVAEAYLTNSLEWDSFCLSDIHADLTCVEVEEIINQAAEHLGYVLIGA